MALSNLKAVLEAAGSGIDNVVKVNIFINNMENFAAMNQVYESVFNKDPKPVSSLAKFPCDSSCAVSVLKLTSRQCRTCVAAFQLPLGTDVEIECIAHL